MSKIPVLEFGQLESVIGALEHPRKKCLKSCRKQSESNLPEYMLQPITTRVIVDKANLASSTLHVGKLSCHQSVLEIHAYCSDQLNTERNVRNWTGRFSRYLGSLRNYSHAILPCALHLFYFCSIDVAWHIYYRSYLPR